MSAQPEDLSLEAPPKHPGGRPSKLTDERAAKFFTAIRNGQPLERAAISAGFTYSTYRNWMDKAQEPNPKPEYRQFFEDMTRVVAEAEGWHLANWSRQSAKDWRASQAWLAMRWPDTYAKNRYEQENGSGPRVSRKDELSEAMSEGSRLLEAGEA